MSRIFREWSPNQAWLFPPSPQDWLPKNHLVYFLLDVSQQIDISPIVNDYHGEFRRHLQHMQSLFLEVLALCREAEVFGKSDGKIFAIVQRELQELLGVTWKPEFSEIARYPRSMPQYHVGHLDRVKKIENHITKMSGLALAGNAFRGVGLPDCVHSGEQAAMKIFRR